MAFTNINNPTDYFNTKLYTGNGSTQSITGVEFQPDLVWIKQRTGTEWHNLIDSVRGGTKVVYSNSSNAEATSSNLITSFDSVGFSIGNAAEVNANTITFASWNWLAGGTASSNTDGSITSNVSANTTSGFSIVSYTGTGSVTSFGHGLGVAPSFVIIKNRDNTDDWTVFHLGISSGQGYIVLNSTAAAVTGSSRRFRYGDDSDGKIPDSSKVYLGTASGVNTSGEDYIAYCFAEKKGFSKFGSYTGNGNANGPFIYTGFKPAWVMYKNISSVADWLIYDTKRIHSGTQLDYLEPNTSDAEGFIAVDVLSNGFKLTEASGDKFNTSGDTYIYMAIAEHPFVSSTGTPVTAR